MGKANVMSCYTCVSRDSTEILLNEKNIMENSTNNT